MADTIVSKFKAQIKEMMSLLAPLKVRSVALNHAESKYNYYHPKGQTAGVESDHIKIFDLQNRTSFAFAFYYNEVENPYILVSIKKENSSGGTESLQKGKYSVETFRQKINEFVKLLKISSNSKILTLKSLESLVFEHFLKNNPTVAEDAVTHAVEKLTEELETLNQEYQDRLDSRKQVSQELKQAQNTKTAAVEQEKKRLGIEGLRQQLSQAELELKQFSVGQDKKLKIKDLELKDRTSKNSLEIYNNAVDKVLLHYTKGFSNRDRKQVEAELTKLKLVKKQ